MDNGEEFQIRVKVVKVGRRKDFVFRWTELTDGRMKPCEKTSKIPAKRQMKQKAERKARELEERLNNPPPPEDPNDLRDLTEPTGPMDWEEFCVRFNSEHMSGLSAKSQEAWRTANSKFKTLCNPGLLKRVTSETLSRFVGKLRNQGIAETSIATYLRTITVALNWAADIELIPTAPRLRQPKRSKGIKKTMRSRPPTGEEYDRLIKAIPAIRPKDKLRFEELLQGLWLSGLRIGEAVALSWEQDAPFSVCLGGRFPMYRIMAEAEKAHTDRLLPIAPEFAEWLSKVPKKHRRGRVFRINLTQTTIEKQITRIGKKAGVIANADGKCATAQDFRRAFGTRWAVRVKPAVLQQLMRHRSIETTMSYYVHMDANDLAEELWRSAPSLAPGGALGGADQELAIDHLWDTINQVAKEPATA